MAAVVRAHPGDTPRAQGLIVVAHPDDEVLFATGCIFRARFTVRFHIMCMTNVDCHVRSQEFAAVLARINLTVSDTTGELFNVPDGAGKVFPKVPKNVPAFLAAIKIRLTDSAVLVSHGHEGEYGHNDHRLVYHLCEQAVVGCAYQGPWVTFKPPSKKNRGLCAAATAFQKNLLECYSSQQAVFAEPIFTPYVGADHLAPSLQRHISSAWHMLLCGDTISE